MSIRNALMVLIRTPATVKWLLDNDPKSLEQAETAVREYEEETRKAERLHVMPEGTVKNPEGDFVRYSSLGYCECCGDEVHGSFVWDGTGYLVQEDSLVVCQKCGCSYVVQVGDEAYINGDQPPRGACFFSIYRRARDLSVFASQVERAGLEAVVCVEGIKPDQVTDRRCVIVYEPEKP